MKRAKGRHITSGFGENISLHLIQQLPRFTQQRLNLLRSAIASLVNRPCLRAFWFAFGAPDPGAPLCMRQRFLPCTAGERHAPPKRVLVPQRGLASIGPAFPV